MALFLLYESAAGYALFERIESEDIALLLPEVQKSVTELSRFSKIVKLKAFLPFADNEQQLDNCNSISEGELNDTLKNFLEQALPAIKKKKKKAKFQLGVVDPKIGNAIQEELGIPSVSNDLILELIRGCRFHFTRFVDELKRGEIDQFQVALAHHYSRSKVKFNVHKVDNMIIQAIALLDQLDKDLNTFSMRVREWYSWHFPELAKVVSDHYKFAQVANYIGDRQRLKKDSETHLDKLSDLTDPEMALQIMQAANASMGQGTSELDMINIQLFATRVISLSEYRIQLHKYLRAKMDACAPNLAALIGEQVGARLISHAGSLTNLAKYPASTVQILGAEKALFRALKTKGNTPKYGLIFNSSFISRAAPKNKGRISRYLANKCSIASRIDSFSEGDPSALYGEKLRDQVEERLEFYNSGEAPKKNIDVMMAVKKQLGASTEGAEDDAGDDDVEMDATPKSKKKKKKDKKDKSSKKKKKRKKAEESSEVTEETETETPKKKKKKKDKSSKKKSTKKKKKSKKKE